MSCDNLPHEILKLAGVISVGKWPAWVVRLARSTSGCSESALVISGVGVVKMDDGWLNI